MKILFYGDSITDATRERGSNEAGRIGETYLTCPRAYGAGYVFLAATELFYEAPKRYQILNRGISGDRLPQLYARLQLDVWSEAPDVLSILVGYNDLDTGENPNYTSLERWGRVYRMMISDTLAKCPETKILICEPFAVKNEIVALSGLRSELIKGYAAEAKAIAEEFGLPFVPLQKKIDDAVAVWGVEAVLYDGIHPGLVGSRMIADAWLEVFRREIK